MSRVGIVLLLTVLGLCHALNFCKMPQCNELPHLGCNNTLVSWEGFPALIFAFICIFFPGIPPELPALSSASEHGYIQELPDQDAQQVP